MGNTFGKLFRITTWGESHGNAIGVVIDGCPPQIPLTEAHIQPELNRRRPGQSKIVTQRKEPDQIKILSGTFQGQTLGTPILMIVHNQDHRPQAYTQTIHKYRPSHADYTYQAKYGIRNWQGGGRSSARETIGRVAAGALAKQILKTRHNTQIIAYTQQIHNITTNINPQKITPQAVEKNIIRCPDPKTATQMIQHIEQTRKKGDSLGGIIACTARNIPPGWGEPVFDRIEADLAKAMLSIPATKGFDIGSGFNATTMTGSQHNDPIRAHNKKIRTTTNHSGGVQGGITNGETIHFRVAFKPTATIMHTQKTINTNLKNTTLKATGRHDPCVIPRAIPIVEAMTALVLLDHALRHHAQNHPPNHTN